MDTNTRARLENIQATVTEDFRRNNPQMFAGQMPEATTGNRTEPPSQTPGLPFALNLLRNDLEQLFTEVSELRERLRPVMLERVRGEEPHLPQPPSPVCKAAMEVWEAHGIVRRLRQVVELTIIELDI